MTAWKKPIAAATVAGALALTWLVGGDVLRSTQYARAAEEIQAAREQLATVQDLATVFKTIGKVVEPSVVKIEVHRTVRAAGGSIDEDFLKQFFPDRDGDGEPDIPEEFRNFRAPDRGYEAFGTGSGVIIETQGQIGYIVTNHHVAGDAREMTITLSDGREIKNAQLVGTDPKSDLAVLKVEADGLIPAKWGNSDYLEKGDIICAFGSPFGYVGSMTHGIVSAMNRDRVGIIGGPYAYENFIQVDAPINPGNSGGPLVNLRGEVVGINTAIATRTGSFTGIGFAIPSNQAQFVYESIKEKGRVVRGWLGVQIQNVHASKEEARQYGYDGNSGVLIKGVQRGAPAVGQLELGDVIVGINGKKIDTMSELRNMVAVTPPGTELRLDVVRGGEKTQTTVKLGEQPDDAQVVARDLGEGGTPRSFEQLGMRLTRPTSAMLEQLGITDALEGALVTSVAPNSPAALAGVARGDLIVKVNEEPVRTPQDVNAALKDADLTEGVRLHAVNREGSKSIFLRVSPNR